MLSEPTDAFLGAANSFAMGVDGVEPPLDLILRAPNSVFFGVLEGVRGVPSVSGVSPTYG